jgi:hypothetical protein
MLKTKRVTMTFALAILLLLFSSAFAMAPTQTRASSTAPSRAVPLQAQAGWSGWSEVPGNGLTPSAPTATRYAGNLSLFVRGTNNRI